VKILKNRGGHNNLSTGARASSSSRSRGKRKPRGAATPTRSGVFFVRSPSAARRKSAKKSRERGRRNPGPTWLPVPFSSPPRATPRRHTHGRLVSFPLFIAALRFPPAREESRLLFSPSLAKVQGGDCSPFCCAAVAG
jgi:hypothetical protein